MPENPIKSIVDKNRSGKNIGIYSVCSANELVLRAAIRHAVNRKYPLIIESTANQVNQFGGYTGIRPDDFIAKVQTITQGEGLASENLILGGDHLGPLVWQNESEKTAMEKAVELVKAYTLAGFNKINLDTSMKLADDPPGPLDPRLCAHRGAVLAKAVYNSYSNKPDSIRPVLVIGSEVPIPGGQKTEASKNETGITITEASDFLQQVSVYKEEFIKAGLDFNDVAAFVVQPGVEFGDDFVHFYNSKKTKALSNALKAIPGFVFEGHSSDYQRSEDLKNMVTDGVAILKVGPGMTFALRETLFLLEAVEEVLIPLASRSNFKKTLLEEMSKNKIYWEKYYLGTPKEIEYKKLYSYSDRCRYYLPAENVKKAMEKLIANIPELPPALLSQFFPLQYRRYMAGKLSNDPLSIIYDRIGEICNDYALACGY